MNSGLTAQERAYVLIKYTGEKLELTQDRKIVPEIKPKRKKGNKIYIYIFPNGNVGVFEGNDQMWIRHRWKSKIIYWLFRRIIFRFFTIRDMRDD